MVFVDVGKEYRAKVSAFNAGSFYGANRATIQQMEQERTETRSQGAFNNTAKPTSYWELDNPHRSVLGDQAYFTGNALWNSKFQEKEIKKIQHVQAPAVGFNRNYRMEVFEEIERNRVSNVIPHMVGDGNSVLIVDKNV